MARKFIVYIATSADGYIARLDGNIDWLTRSKGEDYGVSDFYRTIDAVIWGRRTFDEAVERVGGKVEALVRLNQSLVNSKSQIMNYVISHRSGPEMPGLTFVREPIKPFAAKLRSMPGKDIWMMGGAGVISSFLDEGEIDEFVIHVKPVFIGQGIPLMTPHSRTVKLELLDTKSWADGVTKLHYRVVTPTKGSH
jgi:dihydrofolate reductase